MLDSLRGWMKMDWKEGRKGEGPLERSFYGSEQKIGLNGMGMPAGWKVIGEVIRRQIVERYNFLVTTWFCVGTCSIYFLVTQEIRVLAVRYTLEYSQDKW